MFFKNTKGEIKTYMIVLAPMLIVLIITGFVIALGDGASVYHTTDYNDSQFSSLIDNASLIVGDVETIKDDSNSLTTDPQATGDIFGSLFSGAYNALKQLFQSASIFTKMLEVIIPSLNLGPMMRMVMNFLSFAVLVIITFAVILYYLTKVR